MKRIVLMLLGLLSIGLFKLFSYLRMAKLAEGMSLISLGTMVFILVIIYHSQ
jgi:multisubunit Na+/H+ antiporter MnhC subunit